MCSSVKYVLFVASSMLLTVVSCAPQFQAEDFGRMKETIEACSRQAGVDPSYLPQMMARGEMLPSDGCLIRCIMTTNQWMDPNGMISFPINAPPSVVECVTTSTATINDTCDKAYAAAVCWKQAVDGFRQGFLG